MVTNRGICDEDWRWLVSSTELPPPQTCSTAPSNWRRPGAEGELGPAAAGGARHPDWLPHPTTAPGLSPVRQRQTLSSDAPPPSGRPHTTRRGAAGAIGREPAGWVDGGSWLVESISTHLFQPHLLLSTSTTDPTLCDSRPHPLSQINHCDVTVTRWQVAATGGSEELMTREGALHEEETLSFSHFTCEPQHQPDIKPAVCDGVEDCEW